MVFIDHLFVILLPHITLNSVPAQASHPLWLCSSLLLAGRAVSPCGTLRNVPCLTQRRTLNYLYFIFWFDLLLGMDVRLFSFPAELFYIFPYKSLV